ncbi:MAG TPA: 4a-hydroxytetrahydrobiopterin dehydratase [Aggregatilineaceae bacterium]|nr:4a-hydroxytetrahydrobiopterin dehydratase [Aggregatilineaceae bacterium]
MDALTEAQIKQRLVHHPQWTLADDGQLHADYTFANFMQAVLFLNAIAHLAQVADHHPDLCIHGFKHLSVRLMTHSANGITNKDFNLIEQIDSLPRYS